MDQARRILELRALLRQCRARLGPDDVGSRATVGRRVPGLRRAEVAEFVGASPNFAFKQGTSDGHALLVSVAPTGPTAGDALASAATGTADTRGRLLNGALNSTEDGGWASKPDVRSVMMHGRVAAHVRTSG